eukprot:TRINITY_DN16776_c0_g4_i2.p1 TRINITY_DN16776_c0_g4~~TRINITY_DN16776_c0_g4_i2.p1  ORF type:complete len:1262 (-),score=129.00 TRINITY_DN16776_c0_g4_i2:234-4019(-)
MDSVVSFAESALLPSSNRKSFVRKSLTTSLETLTDLVDLQSWRQSAQDSDPVETHSRKSTSVAEPVESVKKPTRISRSAIKSWDETRVRFDEDDIDDIEDEDTPELEFELKSARRASHVRSIKNEAKKLNRRKSMEARRAREGRGMETGMIGDLGGCQRRAHVSEGDSPDVFERKKQSRAEDDAYSSDGCDSREDADRMTASSSHAAVPDNAPTDLDFVALSDALEDVLGVADTENSCSQDGSVCAQSSSDNTRSGGLGSFAQAHPSVQSSSGDIAYEGDGDSLHTCPQVSEDACALSCVGNVEPSRTVEGVAAVKSGLEMVESVASQSESGIPKGETEEMRKWRERKEKKKKNREAATNGYGKLLRTMADERKDDELEGQSCATNTILLDPSCHSVSSIAQHANEASSMELGTSANKWGERLLDNTLNNARDSMPTSLTCPCGALLPERARFCMACGTMVKDAPSYVPNRSDVMDKHQQSLADPKAWKKWSRQSSQGLFKRYEQRDAKRSAASQSASVSPDVARATPSTSGSASSSFSQLPASQSNTERTSGDGSLQSVVVPDSCSQAKQEEGLEHVVHDMTLDADAVAELPCHDVDGESILASRRISDASTALSRSSSWFGSATGSLQSLISGMLPYLPRKPASCQQADQERKRGGGVEVRMIESALPESGLSTVCESRRESIDSQCVDTLEHSHSRVRNLSALVPTLVSVSEDVTKVPAGNSDDDSAIRRKYSDADDDDDGSDGDTNEEEQWVDSTVPEDIDDILAGIQKRQEDLARQMQDELSSQPGAKGQRKSFFQNALQNARRMTMGTGSRAKDAKEVSSDRVGGSDSAADVETHEQTRRQSFMYRPRLARLESNVSVGSTSIGNFKRRASVAIRSIAANVNSTVELLKDQQDSDELNTQRQETPKVNVVNAVGGGDWLLPQNSMLRLVTTQAYYGSTQGADASAASQSNLGDSATQRRFVRAQTQSLEQEKATESLEQDKSDRDGVTTRRKSFANDSNSERRASGFTTSSKADSSWSESTEKLLDCALGEIARDKHLSVECLLKKREFPHHDGVDSCTATGISALSRDVHVTGTSRGAPEVAPAVEVGVADAQRRMEELISRRQENEKKTDTESPLSRVTDHERVGVPNTVNQSEDDSVAAQRRIEEWKERRAKRKERLKLKSDQPSKRSYGNMVRAESGTYSSNQSSSSTLSSMSSASVVSNKSKCHSPLTNDRSLSVKPEDYSMKRTLDSDSGGAASSSKCDASQHQRRQWC